MSIPARVAAEAAQADAQLAELAAAAKAANDPTPPAPEQPQAPAPEQPPAPPPAPTPSVQPVPDTAEELRRIHQQLGTLQGRYDVILAENQKLRARVEEATRAPPAPPAPAPAPTPVVTAKDREDYGDDLIDLVSRVAAQSIGSRFDEIGTRLAGLEGRLGNTVQQVQSVQQITQSELAAKYFAMLDAQIPGWQQINESPQFLDWLQEPDILTGNTRMQLLQDAHGKAEADRVIHIFRLFKPDLGIGTPAPTPAPPAPAPATPPGHIDPNTLAAPATGAPATPPANPPPGRIWLQAEVDKLYADKHKGRITQADFDKQEKEYFQALAEGRVSTS